MRFSTGLPVPPSHTMETFADSVQGVDLTPDLRVRVTTHQGPSRLVAYRVYCAASSEPYESRPR